MGLTRLDLLTLSHLTDTIDRLWPDSECVYEEEDLYKHLPPLSSAIKLSTLILSEHVKPLFTSQGTVSRNVNLNTGRKVERQHAQLFGPDASVGDSDLLWMTRDRGFWNAMILILSRLSHVRVCFLLFLCAFVLVGHL